MGQLSNPRFIDKLRRILKDMQLPDSDELGGLASG
ncbi:MAG: hypothetical protein QOF85_485 [Solirubrobacterales bacterium]|jgi:hypothetical protein|nr:hypothetical protein [Solirubrobacterales bacterium]